jgi:hypothetical protein
MIHYFGTEVAARFGTCAYASRCAAGRGYNERDWVLIVVSCLIWFVFAARCCTLHLHIFQPQRQVDISDLNPRYLIANIIEVKLITAHEMLIFVVFFIRVI